MNEDVLQLLFAFLLGLTIGVVASSNYEGMGE